MRLPGRGRQCLSGAGRGALGLVAVAVGFGFSSGKEAEGAVTDVAMN